VTVTVICSPPGGPGPGRGLQPAHRDTLNLLLRLPARSRGHELELRKIDRDCPTRSPGQSNGLGGCCPPPADSDGPALRPPRQPRLRPGLPQCCGPGPGQTPPVPRRPSQWHSGRRSHDRRVPGRPPVASSGTGPGHCQALRLRLTLQGTPCRDPDRPSGRGGGRHVTV
jgi:hypothetical protein